MGIRIFHPAEIEGVPPAFKSCFAVIFSGLSEYLFLQIFDKQIEFVHPFTPFGFPDPVFRR
jgi:hypothetical protein